MCLPPEAGTLHIEEVSYTLHEGDGRSFNTHLVPIAACKLGALCTTAAAPLHHLSWHLLLACGLFLSCINLLVSNSMITVSLGVKPDGLLKFDLKVGECI